MNIDRAITEWMGKCWHYPKLRSGMSTCICGYSKNSVPMMSLHFINFRPSQDWYNYGEVLTYLKGHEKWEKFEKLAREYNFWTSLLDPLKGCEAIADYYCEGWREKK